VEEYQTKQAEIHLELDLNNASGCGINLLCDQEGGGGLAIFWSGDLLKVDQVEVPITDWEKGETLDLQIFVDKKFVEVFAQGGRYCITRQVREEHIRGDHMALTSLGGTAKLMSFKAWHMAKIQQ
jgi:sucrose-6-phosphate hydrolase SacC (GH32 family)